MNDLISRQAAIDTAIEAMDEYDGGYVASRAEYLEQALMNLPSAKQEQTISEWIHVGERIPKYGESVLTYIVNGDMKINFIIDEEEREWFYDGVIAWMYLPGPYKESEDVSND